MVIIRELRTDDAEQVSEVARASWQITYRGIFSEAFIQQHSERVYHVKNIAGILKWKQYTKMFVAELEGKIIGFSQPSLYNFWDKETFDPNRMILSRIYLHPDNFGKGIGSLLLKRSEEWMKERGFIQYYLYVHKDNTIGRKFYNKQGFVKIEDAEDDEVLLRKEITII